MVCYVPTWFSVKYHESIVFGSKNFFGLVKRTQNLEETRKLVCPVIQNNGYFSHRECLLLSVIVDHDENLRKLAFLRIMKARRSESNGAQRHYSVPELNFEVHSYGDMISWETRNITDDKSDYSKFIILYTEPPVLSNLSSKIFVK